MNPLTPITHIMPHFARSSRRTAPVARFSQQDRAAGQFGALDNLTPRACRCVREQFAQHMFTPSRLGGRIRRWLQCRG